MKDLCIIAKTSIHLLPFTKKSFLPPPPPPFKKKGGGVQTMFDSI